MKIVSNADKFLTTYNELDSHMRKALGVDLYKNHSYLIKEMEKRNRMFKQYGYDLRAFAELRNAIVHNPDEKNAKPIAEPHDYIVKKYEEMKNKVINPPVALETIAIKAHDIFTTSLEANALDVMKVMNEKTYTHVPVIDSKKLIGVFSENTIFSYLVENHVIATDEDIPISEFEDLIPVDRHASEYFEFVPRDALVIDIEEMFQNGLKENKRISVHLCH